MCTAQSISYKRFANPGTNTYFLVPPKPQEYVLIHWAVYKDGYFYMPAEGVNGFNTEGLSGAVKVNTSMCDYAFKNYEAYEFTAIVKALMIRHAALGLRSDAIQQSAASTYYEIYPVDVKGITTGIGIINADVKGDGIYYNLMGQPVTNPAPGIYIHNGKKIVIK